LREESAELSGSKHSREGRFSLSHPCHNGIVALVQIASYPEQGTYFRVQPDGDGLTEKAHLAGSRDYRAADYSAPCVLLMGNEQQGLTDELAGACDTLVRIPMRGRADSLNLAVATGVLVYEALRDVLR
jgi:tRNA G18 (ribose-2'-O)-methylase SpoU